MGTTIRIAPWTPTPSPPATGTTTRPPSSGWSAVVLASSPRTPGPRTRPPPAAGSPPTRRLAGRPTTTPRIPRVTSTTGAALSLPCARPPAPAHSSPRRRRRRSRPTRPPPRAAASAGCSSSVRAALWRPCTMSAPPLTSTGISWPGPIPTGRTPALGGAWPPTATSASLLPTAWGRVLSTRTRRSRARPGTGGARRSLPGCPWRPSVGRPPCARS
mmetsp:Transcript_122265/g.280068  ORF Transcript_122265/g.280068 Transcript_122265/m.280068 type:complete len:216 (+) Transcript_122265:2879-3526(+)